MSRITAFMVLLSCFALGHSSDTPFQRICNGRADAVFLWVNGTSPEHIKTMEKYGRVRIGGLYKDYGTLRFGLRSVVEYAPWIHRIFLVTNGEVPSYIDETKGATSDPQLIVISHEKIMDNNVLPTFNSNSIESYIHHIPDIAPCVLYLNDDMMLGRPVDPSFWINDKSKLNLYYNGFVAPNTQGEQTSTWHRSVSHTNQLVNDLYHMGEVKKHPYPSHHCYFLLTDTLRKMEDVFKANYTVSRANKFRKANDIVVSFLHAAVSSEAGKGEYIKQRNRFYFSWWSANHTENVKTMKRIKAHNNWCICLNDNIGNADPEAVDAEIEYLNQAYSEILPNPAPFER